MIKINQITQIRGNRETKISKKFSQQNKSINNVEILRKCKSINLTVADNNSSNNKYEPQNKTFHHISLTPQESKDGAMEEEEKQGENGKKEEERGRETEGERDTEKTDSEMGARPF